ncbi:hypothetical protein HaLaN_30377 [Haematococcus lacustris]|uniref:Uncharacterized protein n=1 Tax=Haematococcus lacustris TaxID=44745 RepID=A0A6A0AFD2_HAELA|nr:hypothetical protein HaLaN_30377 [Haematococcus lacustris]
MNSCASSPLQPSRALAALAYSLTKRSALLLHGDCQLHGVCVDGVGVTPQVDVTQLLQLGQELLVAGVLKDWHEHEVATLLWAHKPPLQLIVDGLEVGVGQDLAEVLELPQQDWVLAVKGGLGRLQGWRFRGAAVPRGGVAHQACQENPQHKKRRNDAELGVHLSPQLEHSALRDLDDLRTSTITTLTGQDGDTNNAGTQTMRGHKQCGGGNGPDVGLCSSHLDAPVVAYLELSETLRRNQQERRVITRRGTEGSRRLKCFKGLASGHGSQQRGAAAMVPGYPLRPSSCASVKVPRTYTGPMEGEGRGGGMGESAAISQEGRAKEAPGELLHSTP